MRNQEAAVMLGIDVIRQQRIDDIDLHVLPVVADEHLLFGRDDLIDASVETVGARGHGYQRLVVQSTRQSAAVRKRVVGIEQRLGGRIELRAWNRVIRIRLSSEWIRQRTGHLRSQPAQIAPTLGERWNRVLFRFGRALTIAFVIEEEEGLIVPVVKMGRYQRTAHAATEGIE